MSSGAYTVRWLAAWVLALVLLGFLARSRFGYNLIYYVVVLGILFVLVTQYRRVAAVLAPIQATTAQPAPQG